MLDTTTILFYIYGLYIITFVIVLILDNREPASIIAWTTVLILLPVIGILVYLLIGRNWRKISKKKKVIKQELSKYLVNSISAIAKREKENISHLLNKEEYKNKAELLNLLKNNSNSILTSSNKIEILQSGEEKFQKLIEDIKQAEKFIHLEYFIWRNDKLTKKINGLLIKKAKQGVEVRIIYDTWGSFSFSRLTRWKMRKSGIKIYPYFNFISPFKFHTLNYRNHRKIAIIDGKVAYTGGMNMAKEYIDGGRMFKKWRDTHLRIRGDAVEILQGIFAISWYNTTKEKLFNSKYFTIGKTFQEKTPMHITTCGPDSEWDSIKQLYFTLIATAQKRVYIQTPYFIPDPSVQMALKVAALSGVDVRVMMAGIPDKWLPFWAAQTYLEELLAAGVKIYQYKQGFLHSKTVMADDSVCSIGTANMDVRSFELMYELNTIIYDKSISERLKNDFLEDMKSCEETTLEKIRKENIFIKFRNSLARLFAPLL
ncbi:MAG: cardiolipin synthase [Nanoarchaeota archaeon]|nr:cardiolipin synthase [Nanoarchaeota archaeon]MBU0978014.1 cardiolipin synthase [Nanoarchaeota archaeon]